MTKFSTRRRLVVRNFEECPYFEDVAVKQSAKGRGKRAKASETKDTPKSISTSVQEDARAGEQGQQQEVDVNQKQTRLKFFREQAQMH